ncbi:hydrogen peroxide-dependent heme synthase [Pirellulaceae bacterium SH449]
MNPHGAPAQLPEPSVVPVQGWHCGHYFYRWNRTVLKDLFIDSATRSDFCQAITAADITRPERIQSFIVSGHKADFGLVMMDPNPLVIDHVHQRIMSSKIGAAVEAVYSFVSVSEISEYLPDKDQYAQKLIRSGEDPNSPTFLAKVSSYEKRLPMMFAQRLAPDFPTWPAMCFYPMNKSRDVGANWFLQPFSSRMEMMAEHAQSGMAFAGRVTQLVTSSVGLDDWEWGVTLWARNPQFLKEIVYTMRYDKASATFGEFGQFYTGYLSSPEQILAHCRI